MPLRRDVYNVWILRMNHDSPDVPGRLQTHFFPAFPAVERLVRPIAPGGALPVVRLPPFGPHHGRVGRCNGDVANRRYALLVEYRLPRRAIVRRLPYAT